MAKGLITHAYLENTADAIRVLRGENDTYTPDEFGGKILDAIPDVEVTDSIVSVTDAAAYPAEELEFAIEPVQDLHGYDKPWPAGGGKNKLPANVNTQTIGGVTFTVNKDSDGNVISITTSGTSTETIDFFFYGESYQSRFINSLNGSYTLSGCPSGGSVSTYRMVVYGYANAGDTSNTYTLSDTGAGSTDTVNCAAYVGLINVKSGVNMDGKTFQPMLRLSTESATFAPYSNICPISGWTAVNGVRCGKNLLKLGIPSSQTSIISVNNDGAIILDGATESGTVTFINTIEDLKIGCDYIYSFEGEFPTSSFALTIRGDYSVTIKNETREARFTYTGGTISWRMNTAIAQASNVQIKPLIRPANNANPDFTPYKTPAQIPITFPAEAGIVYGGKVDVVNGKLLAYPEYDSYNGETLTGEWVSSMDAYAEGTTPTIGAQVVDLSGVGTEYDITPQQVQMLLGDNNIWCDTGDTTLKYKVDLGRYIQKLQAAQATPQLSLTRQAVSLDAPMDVEVRSDETPTADTTEDDALSK